MPSRVRPGLPARLQTARPEGPVGLQRRMRYPPDMPELQKDPAARAMHGIGHALPAGDLVGAVDAGRTRIADALRRHLRRLADDQAGAGALRVIGGVERPGHVARPGAIARHRRHHHAVGQRERAEMKRGKEVDIGHGVFEALRPNIRTAVSIAKAVRQCAGTNAHPVRLLLSGRCVRLMNVHPSGNAG